MAAKSGTYDITAVAAVRENSAITRDSTSYVSGSDITVTVTLKDGSTTPAPVSWLSSDALKGLVSVANAEPKSGMAWAETAAGLGVYTGVYVARTVGAGLVATLNANDGSKSSDTYDISATSV